MRRAFFVLALALAPQLVLAAEATVEDISGAADSKVQAWDSLNAGDIVDLGTGRMVISYLADCRRETIVGGKVTVGRERSAIAGGKLESAEQPPCKAKLPTLMANSEAREAGAAVKRHAGKAVMAPEAAIVATATPMFRWDGGAGTLRVWELGAVRQRLVLEQAGAASGWMARIGGAAFKPGVFYSASVALDGGGERRMDFNLDPRWEGSDVSAVELR